MPIHLPPNEAGVRRPGPRETVALLAGLMALNAFAIDAMIPALPRSGWTCMSIPKTGGNWSS